MIARIGFFRSLPRAVTATALLGLGIALAGCAGMSDTVSPAFADPGKYDLYDCKQLEAERKVLATKGAELQGLMAKAETGVAGSVVAEVAYRNDYIANRGQTKLAEEAWQRNKCHASPPTAASDPAAPAAPSVTAKRAKSPARSGSAIQ